MVKQEVPEISFFTETTIEVSGTVRINYFRALKSSEILAAFRGVLNEKGINFPVHFRKF